MALSFLTSADATIEVVVTCDPEVESTSESRQKYLNSGKMSDLDTVGKGATRFTLKALSPADREQAEMNAGAMTRSELGRLLHSEAPEDSKLRAQWHHALTDEERLAMSDYQSYLNRVYKEMLRIGLIKIDADDADVESLELIRPDSNRVQVITELVYHLQRISLLGVEGK